MFKKLSNIIRKWREKYKLTYMNADTFDVKWSIKLSFINFLTLLVFLIFIISISTYFLLVYTPLKRFTFESVSMYTLNDQQIKNSKAIVKAEKLLEQHEKYSENLRKILLDEPFDDTATLRQIDTLEGAIQVDFENSAADSILRNKIESSLLEPKNEGGPFQADFFMSPVSGTVSRSTNFQQKHYGVDIVTKADEPVKAVLEGLVVFAGWTNRQGNVIILQHQNNLITAYKHCSVLMKAEGDFVQAGDPIGIVGTSGELTDGPHLHFEIWQKGVPLNPQEFISF
ncbi:MAG: M23 family metallopeptidase [Putridiphycobacter sp.]|nr:M23 family metallopeptidase [Putridiphycobacter sp.]